jgi:ABC-type dipeptide/oligopeptide/nickel transport system permease component
MSLGSYILRRLLWAPVILFFVSAITFGLARFGPGDPVRTLLGQHRDPEAEQRIRTKFGLDKSPVEQYVIYMSKFFQGDWGESFKHQDIGIRELIVPKMAVSFQIGLVALCITFGLGIPLGIFAATKTGTWQDPATVSGLLLFTSVPVIVVIPLAQWIFSVRLGWTGIGWDGLLSTHAIMPILILSLPGVAGVARLMRAQTLQVLDQDYVRTARAKGLSEYSVMFGHVLQNAMLPLVTIVGLSLVGVLEGAFFVETLFGVPGVARLSVESVFDRDYDVIMALTMIIAISFILANIAIDIAYTAVDPRIRLGGEAPH